MSEEVDAPGHLLDGKYEIVGAVGEGAWGLVLEGINLRIRRKVAIKILKAEYASRADMVSRFEREALASTHIESPHVVQVYDAGVLADGRPYLVMEFLTGEDLGTHITAKRRLPIGTAVDLCAQVARGLAAAHAAGVFHRDMKPNNIVIARTKSGREIVKIVDFGISKLVDTSLKEISQTQTGTVLGSPVYMSPEQARGSKASDHRSDLYSLGVVLFECLTGRTPHDGEGFNALLFKIALEPAPSVRSLRPEIDEELDAIVRRLLAKQPDERVQSATELEQMLNDWMRKNGVRLGETPTESGPRALDGFTTSSPLGSPKAVSVGQLGTSGLPSLESTMLLESSGALSSGALHVASAQLEEDARHEEVVAKLVPAPTAAEPRLSGVPVKRTNVAVSSPGPAPRRGYVLAGAVALVVLAGAFVVATRRPAGTNELVSTGHTNEPAVPSTSPEPSTTATSGPTSAPQPVVETTSVVAGTNAGNVPERDRDRVRVREGAGVPIVRPVIPGTPATSSPGHLKAPASSAGSRAATPPAASAAGSANVGGRTIRTEF